MYKGFTHSFEFLPFLTDFFTVLLTNFSILPAAFGYDLEKVRKFTDQFLGMGKEVLAGILLNGGIRTVESVRFLTEPGNDLLVPGGLKYSGKTIEWVGGPTVGGFGSRLAPFVEQGRGNSEVGRDCFYADILD
jgi:hypothetical protein